jgi:ketosteroid isomerase-like protein
MKRAVVLLSAALVVVSSSGGWIQSAGAQVTAGDASAEIRALETAQSAAIMRRDAAALDKLMSDDHTFITPRGFLVTKAQMLKALADGGFRYEYREISELQIRVWGEAAVVTGRSRYTGQNQGKDYSDAYRYTRMYVRQKGHWLSVAWQVTREDESRRPGD